MIQAEQIQLLSFFGQTYLSLDISLIRKFFSWQPDTPLEEGIKKTMA